MLNPLGKFLSSRSFLSHKVGDRFIFSTAVAVAISILAMAASGVDEGLGFYSRAEGMVAQDITSGIGENYVAYSPAEFPWGDALPGTSDAFAGRGELGFDFEGAEAVRLRTGITGFGWSVSQDPSDNVHGAFRISKELTFTRILVTIKTSHVSAAQL